MKSRAGNKILAFALAAVMLLCGVFAAPPVTAYAAEVEIGTPDDLTAGENLAGTQVYFGSYDSRSDNGDSDGPILWRVVATDNGTATLWTTTSMGKMAYNSSDDHKYWKDSTICWWLNDDFLTGAFKEAEQEAINPEYGTANEPYGESFWAGTIDSRQKIVLPSVAEIGNGTDTGTWGIDYTNSVDNKRGFEDRCWLRSPGYYADTAACVDTDGSVYAEGDTVYDFYHAIRPAFKLNLSSVVFTSAASGGKSAATAGSGLVGASAPTGAVKLTVLDSGQSLEVVTNTAGSEQSGSTLQFGYRNATTGPDQYVSCVLVNSGDEVAYYGKLADCETDESGTLPIPLSGVGNGTYTLKIFSEQANGDNYTDFCSTPVEMTVEVDNETGKVSNFKGTVEDEPPPQTDGPDVRPRELNLDLNGSPSKPLTVSLGQNGSRAATAGVTVKSGYEDYISVDEEILDDDGTVTVTGYRAVNGAQLTVTFSGGDIDAPVTIPVTVSVTDSSSSEPPPPPTPQPTPRSRSSDSGGSYTPPAATIPSTLVVDAARAKAALAEREKSGANKARIRHNGEIRVLAEVWPVFGDIPVDFDTLDGGAVGVRVTIREPGKMTGDRLLSGYVKGGIVNSRRAFFEKWFQNKVRVIHFDQSEPWGQPVEVAAKVDLTGMDTDNLYFYSYDKKTNTYKRIEKPAYWIDKNGYLHFAAENAGDIIISDGPVERR